MVLPDPAGARKQVARRGAERRATIPLEPLAQLVEHRPFKPRVVGSIPTRLTLQCLDRVREILGALRRGKRLGRGRQQTVSKRSRSNAAYGIAQVLQREVSVGPSRCGHRGVPQDTLHTVSIDAGAKHERGRNASREYRSEERRVGKEGRSRWS